MKSLWSLKKRTITIQAKARVIPFTPAKSHSLVSMIGFIKGLSSTIFPCA